MHRFRLQCTLRVLAIGATMLASLWLMLETTSYVAAALLVGAVAMQLHSLVRYVERTNRDLDRFLRSIRYSDFSQAFTGKRLGPSFAELAASFGEVMDDFREARAEKEENVRYLQTVMQHVGVGLISFRRDGHVELINNAAKRLLRVPRLRHIQELDAVSPELTPALRSLHAGDKRLVQVVDGDELLQLAIYATEFKLRDELYTLVSIQNIQSELEEQELASWQKLTRVLTHEIMNSITPISSLASTVKELLREEEQSALAGGDGAVEAEIREDVRAAVDTIERRSEGLLTFVNAYRRLTRIPKPEFQIIPVRTLFGDIARLLQPQLDVHDVALTIDVDPEGLDVTADRDQIEQVLINLVQNAMQAVGGQPDAAIRLTAHLDARGRTTLRVQDNGPGIVPEALGKIFIPFFTTKKEGSGIGLSFSREVMRQHGGTLSVRSEPGVETTFTLRF